MANPGQEVSDELQQRLSRGNRRNSGERPSDQVSTLLGNKYGRIRARLHKAMSKRYNEACDIALIEKYGVTLNGLQPHSEVTLFVSIDLISMRAMSQASSQH